MKALLYKDWLVAKKYLKMFLLMDLIFVVIAIVSGKETPFLALFPPVMCAPVITSLLSYDERFRFDRACDMMPLPRKVQVDEKYLLALIYVGVIFLLCTLGVLRNYPDRAERWLLMTGMLTGGLLPAVLLLPIIFRLGSEKGRMFYYVIYLGSLGLTYAASDAGTSADGEALRQSFGSNTFGLVLAFLLALYALSWRLSIRFYRTREL